MYDFEKKTILKTPGLIYPDGPLCPIKLENQWIYYQFPWTLSPDEIRKSVGTANIKLPLVHFTPMDHFAPIKLENQWRCYQFPQPLFPDEIRKSVNITNIKLLPADFPPLEHFTPIKLEN